MSQSIKNRKKWANFKTTFIHTLRFYCIITAHSSPKKPPRPISAVPSEYSDISTSSCRTSDDGGESDESKVKIEAEPVRISIVVKKENLEEEDEAKTEVADSHELAMLRVFRVASELLSTEEQYVTVLYLIDQVRPIVDFIIHLMTHVYSKEFQAGNGYCSFQQY